ncbi:hypothetical protein Goshw_026812 [Gossypium schwendimanii]|uniref:Uncharacterized protein n=1 Tax=Gossypium schwendimanii TaxID=34291 RepID=A0A7J9MW10_GOSSC|nr:hypothetical protein [Gossypium schwendimanii]
MKNKIAWLSIADGEEEAWQITLEGNEAVSDTEFCLVGCLLVRISLFVDFYVQIYDLPNGLMFVTMVKQFDNFIGSYIDYDAKSIT